MENLKIEVGKEYRTRYGHKVRVYATDGGYSESIHGAILTQQGWEIKFWRSDGQRFPINISPQDIISEWKLSAEDIGFDPSCLPAWANKFIAIDEDGTWYSYAHAPKLGEDCFWSTSAAFTRIPPEYAPKNFTGDWKDSLIEL